MGTFPGGPEALHFHYRTQGVACSLPGLDLASTHSETRVTANSAGGFRLVSEVVGVRTDLSGWFVGDWDPVALPSLSGEAVLRMMVVDCRVADNAAPDHGAMWHTTRRRLHLLLSWSISILSQRRITWLLEHQLILLLQTSASDTMSPSVPLSHQIDELFERDRSHHMQQRRSITQNTDRLDPSCGARELSVVQRVLAPALDRRDARDGAFLDQRGLLAAAMVDVCALGISPWILLDGSPGARSDDLGLAARACVVLDFLVYTTTMLRFLRHACDADHERG